MMFQTQKGLSLRIFSSYKQQKSQVSVYMSDAICGILYNINLSQKNKTKMEIDEQILNEILSQRNVPNIKGLYASKAKKHNLGLQKQISTTKKDIVSIAKKLNRRQLAKQLGLESTAQKWLWKEQKLFVWITIYYSEVKFLQLNSFGQKDFKVFQKLFPLKNPQFLHYEYYLAFCVDKDLRVVWSQEEIEIFEKILNDHEVQKNLYHWKKISFELYRSSNGCFFKSAESCRNRWENHSNPNLNKNVWSADQDYKLMQAMSFYGSKWAKLARTCFSGRTEHMIKNRYRCLCKKYGLNHQSVETTSIRLLGKLENNPDLILKEESQSQNSQKTQQEIVKLQHQEPKVKQEEKVDIKQMEMVKCFQQFKIVHSNYLTIDEILSLKFKQHEEQWMDGIMNELQNSNPNILIEEDYF